MTFSPYGYPYYMPGQTPQPSSQFQPPAPSPTLGFSLVNNEQEARNWVVLPGQSMLLMCRNEPVFWIKSTDQSGLSQPMRVFSYVEQGPQSAPPAAAAAPQVEYVPRQEYNALAARVEALEAQKQPSKEEAASSE